MQSFFARCFYCAWRTAVLFVTAIVFAAITYTAYYPPGDWYPDFAHSALSQQLFSSYTLLHWTALGADSVRHWNEFPRLRFIRLFGKSLANYDYQLCAPAFEMSEESREALKAAGLESSLDHFQLVGVSTGYSSGHINKIIAAADMVGVAYVADAVGDHTKRGPQIVFNQNLFGGPRSFFSFGLQTNVNAEQFLQDVNNAEKRQILWQRKRNKAMLPENFVKLCGIKDFCSVNVVPSSGGRTATIVVDDGVEPLTFHSRDDQPWNLGIIVVMRSRHDANLRRILCAGAGPGGTSGSSYYLSRNWERLSSDMKKPVDALLILTATKLRGNGNERIEDMQANDIGTLALVRIACVGMFKSF